MKTIRFQKFIVIPVITIAILVACSPGPSSIPDSAQPGDDIIGMPNPSAVYCEGLGYTTETVERNGGQDSDCIFPDGSRCDTWDFLAGGCGQQYTFCATQGYLIESSDDSNIGNCLFPDGSFCGEFDYFTGACSPSKSFQAP